MRLIALPREPSGGRSPSYSQLIVALRAIGAIHVQERTLKAGWKSKAAEDIASTNIAVYKDLPILLP